MCHCASWPRADGAQLRARAGRREIILTTIDCSRVSHASCEGTEAADGAFNRPRAGAASCGIVRAGCLMVPVAWPVFIATAVGSLLGG